MDPDGGPTSPLPTSVLRNQPDAGGLERGADGEVQLTDGMASLIGTQPFHGVRYEGRRFDCGDKAGFLEAQIAFALKRPDMAPAVREFLKRYT